MYREFRLVPGCPDPSVPKTKIGLYSQSSTIWGQVRNCCVSLLKGRQAITWKNKLKDDFLSYLKSSCIPVRRWLNKISLHTYCMAHCWLTTFFKIQKSLPSPRAGYCMLVTDGESKGEKCSVNHVDIEHLHEIILNGDVL